ncbi:MAG: flavin-containing monooxygenase [Actinomycetes bacterium]
MDSTAPEHLDVVVVGAGLSGIAAGHYLRTECPWASYAVLEGRSGLGGTWDLFRYPGIRSDSDMHTLGYSFRPWRGEHSIADGPDILDYLQATAADEGIDRLIRFGHRVRAAEWSSATSTWLLTVDVVGADGAATTRQLTCGFLFSCAGYYRYDRGYEPEFDGLDDFGGRVVHPQFWPEDLDVTGRRVVVIGSGATAMTLVPALARTAGHVTMLQRSPTYVLSRPRRSGLATALRRTLPRRWADPAVRWLHALVTQGFYQVSRRRPAQVRKGLVQRVAQQLPADYDVATHFTPRYDPWDQRVCVVPDGDLFTAVREGRATVVTDTIDTFTPEGVRLDSGDELPADVVVTATGLELLFLGGVELVVDGQPVVASERLTYKGMMLEGVPNLAMAVGYTNASWTLKAELTCEYVCRILNHLRRTGASAATPRNDGAEADPAPLMALTSGYVTRAAGTLPQQGSRFPWRVYQSFVKDYRAMRLSKVDDGVVQFS